VFDRITVLDRITAPMLSVYRVVVGMLFACHGLASLFGMFGGAMGRGGSIPAGTWPGWWAALIQLVGGALVMVGLGTRAAAVLCSGSMAYAYFTVHQERALLPIQNGGEAAAMFCWAFLLVAVLGPGPLSIDEYLRRLRARTARPARHDQLGDPLRAPSGRRA
jgi:putative oxidoreductase